MEADIFQPQPQLDTVRIRTERVLKFVSRRLMLTTQALEGCYPPEAAGIDPDLPSEDIVATTIQAMGKAELMAWIAEHGMLENEVAIVHTLRVYVNGKLAHEQELT